MLLKRYSLSIVFFASIGLGLGGCVFVVDEPHDYGHSPAVYDSGATYWFCEWDTHQHDYYWEYQAEVYDADGLGDLRLVDVTFYDTYTGAYVDQVELFEESGGIWGAWSWERETRLYCGEAYDAVFYVEDWNGNSDSLVLSEVINAPSISENPIDTWVDCFESGHDWMFEFQTRVSDADGFADVEWVVASFYDYYTGDLAGEYTLNWEGDGYWGGWIEEGNGNALYCGDAYDVTFYAEDASGLFDSFSFTFMP